MANTTADKTPISLANLELNNKRMKEYVQDEISKVEGLTVDSVLSDTSTNSVQNKVIKTELDKKADKSEIPTTLPANGGNADTVDGKHASDFANAYNDLLKNYLSGQAGDIRALAYKLPMGNYAFSVSDSGLGNITFPLNQGSLTWIPSKNAAQNLIYGLLIIRPLTSSTGSTFMCTIYNTKSYTGWQEIPIDKIDLSPYMKISTEIPVQNAASTVSMVTQNGIAVVRDYVAKPINASSCTRYYRTFAPDGAKYVDMRTTVTNSSATIQFVGTGINISAFTVNGKQVVTEGTSALQEFGSTPTLSNNTKTDVAVSFNPKVVLLLNNGHIVTGGYAITMGTKKFSITPASVSAMGTVAPNYIAFG